MFARFRDVEGAVPYDLYPTCGVTVGVDAYIRPKMKKTDFDNRPFHSNPFISIVLDRRKSLDTFIRATVNVFIISAALQYDFIIRIPLNTPH